MTIKVGDYLRLIRDLSATHTSMRVGQVFEVMDAKSSFPILAGVYIDGDRRWLTTTEYELLTPFEVAVHRRLKETTNAA